METRSDWSRYPIGKLGESRSIDRSLNRVAAKTIGQRQEFFRD
jgi:hypothetical protein